MQPYYDTLSPQQKAFVDYVTSIYVKNGFEELDADKLPTLMAMKFGTIQDGMTSLGGIDEA